ncbi:MAG: hypothetical protein FWG10_01165 [Eubacteriaceae bacterium]|nr:hypothetical protein [Eubacteriaceae bacterium]
MAKLKFKFESGILFKMLLTRNPGLLKSLVACSLEACKRMPLMKLQS